MPNNFVHRKDPFKCLINSLDVFIKDCVINALTIETYGQCFQNYYGFYGGAIIN